MVGRKIIYMDLTLACLCTDKIKCDPIQCLENRSFLLSGKEDCLAVVEYR